MTLPRKFQRKSDGKIFTEIDHGTPLYHPHIESADGETDVVKCISNGGYRYVSLDNKPRGYICLDNFIQDRSK